MFKKIKKIAIVAACAVAASTMLTFAASAASKTFTDNVGSPWNTFYGQLYIYDSDGTGFAYSNVGAATSTSYLRVGLSVVDYASGETIFDGVKTSGRGARTIEIDDDRAYDRYVSAYGSYELIDGSYANGHYLELINV